MDARKDYLGLNASSLAIRFHSHLHISHITGAGGEVDLTPKQVHKYFALLDSKISSTTVCSTRLTSCPS